jgi:hypothetical protein
MEEEKRPDFVDNGLSKSRWWFATWNNPPEEEDPASLGLKHNRKIGYVTGQREVSKKGTDHLFFDDQKRLIHKL